MEYIPLDTTFKSAKIQRNILRQMSLEEKVRITFDLCDQIRKITEAGIKEKHRDYDDEMVRLATIRRLLGKKLFEKAFLGKKE